MGNRQICVNLECKIRYLYIVGILHRVSNFRATDRYVFSIFINSSWLYCIMNSWRWYTRTASMTGPNTVDAFQFRLEWINIVGVNCLPLVVVVVVVVVNIAARPRSSHSYRHARRASPHAISYQPFHCLLHAAPPHSPAPLYNVFISNSVRCGSQAQMLRQNAGTHSKQTTPYECSACYRIFWVGHESVMESRISAMWICARFTVLFFSGARDAPFIESPRSIWNRMVAAAPVDILCQCKQERARHIGANATEKNLNYLAIVCIRDCRYLYSMTSAVGFVFVYFISIGVDHAVFAYQDRKFLPA